MQLQIDKKQLKIGRMQPLSNIKLKHERRELYMNFSDNLKKIRKEHNLSQEQLAEQLGVSRQSVSKWESGQAYPEMDKMLSLCQLFNLNIDDLLNQDIKEVNSNKQAKNNINKFIDDFLDYITKTINLFSSMSIKQKIKCIFEQVILLGIITIILLIIGTLLSSVFNNLFSFLPYEIYFPIYHILEAIYLIFCLILSLILITHNFKVRYLDYYILEKATNNEEENIEYIEPKQAPLIQEEKTIHKMKSKEKIIIRDPKHSEYKFISSLLKCLLFITKALAFMPLIISGMSLIFIVVSIVISFLIIKSGTTFIGILLILTAILLINIIILTLIYSFITSKKIIKPYTGLVTLISIILFGIGIGLTITSTLEYKVIEEITDKHYHIEETTIPMSDKLYIIDYFNGINYIESSNQDIKIKITTSDYFDIELTEHDANSYYFNSNIPSENINKLIKQTIKDINKKEIVDYSNYKIEIYTTKENIQKLKENLNNRYNYENNYYKTIQEYRDIINELERKICKLEGYC